MEFKSDKTNKTTKATSAYAVTTAIVPTSKAGAFKVNTDSFAGALQGVIPEGMRPMVAEIGQGLGVDLTDLSKLTKEQVMEAKKLAAQLDEKLMCMKELAPCIMKFLAFQVSAAEFQAEIVVQAAKAKTKIDQAAAKAYVAYYRYLRKAQNLEKRVNQQRQIIDAAYNAFESVQDARSNAILSGLNQQARLGVSTAQHANSLKQERQQILAERKNNLQQMKHDLKTSHLGSTNS
ncbi:hypothetical protein F7734_52180 [Scytonema sp. UIC 10036]|uniref:hypothetical protein n=1 Tax=Scytonema sp. UIC 10036 TaxID=2304196 RepID=UPI0012DA3194|nr:hypothetical protein [Scytonema sp. UIC 10036]MUH00382.1 hypothetical protein [Scytonema sp. UIC 10036]